MGSENEMKKEIASRAELFDGKPVFFVCNCVVGEVQSDVKSECRGGGVYPNLIFSFLFSVVSCMFSLCSFLWLCVSAAAKLRSCKAVCPCVGVVVVFVRFSSLLSLPLPTLPAKCRCLASWCALLPPSGSNSVRQYPTYRLTVFAQKKFETTC